MRWWKLVELCIFFILLLNIFLIWNATAEKTGTGNFPQTSFSWLKEANTINISSDTCCGSGTLRKSPLDLSHLIGKKISGARSNTLSTDSTATEISTETYYPSSFDLRNSSKVPAIRDQGQSGSCWDFAAVKSFESSMLPKVTKDFSENNLKNHVSVYAPKGFDYADGGNDLMSAAYFLRGSGPVPEKLDPYNPYSFISPENLPVETLLSDVPMIPGRSGPTDNENIKWGVVNLGCLYTTLLFDNAYYSDNYTSYYNPDGTTPNHAVSIIGWDDNYPASSFVETPDGDGAFICANSWGTNWGDDGFFYISYYDALVGKRLSAFIAATDGRDGSYGYDDLGWVNSFGFGSAEASAANVFTAEADIKVTSAGFYLPQVGTSVTASVYLDPENGPIGSSEAATSQSKTYEVPGYHSLNFDFPVKVEKGQKFSIIVNFYTPDYGFPIPVEYPVAGYSSKATASEGQSYVMASNGSWSDLTTWDPQANACIRAGYTLVSGPKTDFYGEPVTGSAPLTVSFQDMSSGNPERWLWQFGDGSTSTEQNPIHTYYQNGTYSVSLTSDTPEGESKLVKDNYITVSQPTTITVPDDHSLIQEAINSAPAGSTILVRYGYYPEKITISKPVTLTGISSGDGQKPIIDAQYAGTPVSITSTGVTVDNFSLTGAWSETAIRPGIAIRGNSSVIKNNWIFENYAGVRFESVTGGTLDGNTIWNSTSSAVYCDSGSYLDIVNNTIVWTSGAPAIQMVFGYNSVIKGNAIAENTKAGLSVSGTGITVYDNYLNNTNNVALTSDTKVSWNISKSQGPNIVLGPYIGGNYWAAPDGGGFSETHNDEDGDGFCDEAYQLGGENVDDLPLHNPASVLPTADFTATPRSGSLPLPVQFVDTSLGTIESWQWDFGDGETSTETNPYHIYLSPGVFDVNHSVTGPKGTDFENKLQYITVTGTGNSYNMTIFPGWNFFTPPKTLSSGTDTASIFASVPTDGHSIFTFPNSTTGWTKITRDTVLQPVTGYWIYSKERRDIVLYLSPVGGGSRVINSGWNSIGSMGTGPEKANVEMSNLGESWQYLVGYDESCQKYEDPIIRKGSGDNSDSRLLRSGHGYWLYATGTGILYAA